MHVVDEHPRGQRGRHQRRTRRASAWAVVLAGALGAVWGALPGEATAADETPGPFQRIAYNADRPQWRADAQPGPSNALREAVLSVVEKWRADWERRDIDAYLDNYVEGVSPQPQRSRDEWESDRRRTLLAPLEIRITVSDVAISSLGPVLAEVRLSQHYESDTFEDRVRKSLSLMLTREGWRIRHEEILVHVD